MPRKKAQPKNNQLTYEAKDIYVLEGLEPVRRRPGMYIGSTGSEGLHHLVWECVDNAIDEAMAGFAKNIEAILLPQNRVKVIDDGRGIPVGKHPQTKKSALETVMCTLHAGGKFGGQSYKVAGGLHGVGVSVVNALSCWMRVEVCRDGYLYAQEYSRGKRKTAVKKLRKCQGTGTSVIFEPDPEIFKEVEFNWQKILDHLRQQAYLTKGVRIVVRDLREVEGAKLPGARALPVKTKKIKKLKSLPPKNEDLKGHSYAFFFEGGIISYIKYLNRRETARHENIFYIDREQEGVQVEVVFQYTNDIQGYEIGFANNIHTPEGGMHVTGFRTALTRSLNDYARKSGFLKDSDENLSGDDVREGLASIISVKLKEPQFEGQTKAKLGNPEVRSIVDIVVSEALEEFLEKHPTDAKEILARCALAAKARQAAKAARETVIRRGLLEGLALPGKLADCSSRDADASELFIVEGDSAGGSAKQARNRIFQAILPLRGKILNVEKARLDRALSSKEIKALVIALGAAIAEEFDIEKLRYKRIIIMTDADIDGAHIRTLLLTLFFRYFPEIIERGYLYIAQPPLYRIQRGTRIEYAYTEADKKEIIGELLRPLPKEGKGRRAQKKTSLDEGSEEEKTTGINIQRYKGLGEMNPDQLWETTMNPENRIMRQVSIEDAKEADTIFDILMGDEVAPRRRFIQVHAKKVRNLDI